MCCRRKTGEFVPERVPELEEPNNFLDLLESLKVEFKGTKELEILRDQLVAREEWKNPNAKNYLALRTEAQNLTAIMIRQIKVMARGLRTLVLINEKLEDGVRNSAE
ncbi:unnamed protein product [Blepharisma stoltei]|uniref:Uncharacterized protein n=1 Tax=Blepharisma stoltei TaxID=1481888 RepID=A0AAU9IU94_9CILI|nr:unnamed protein product [Blepharisma stoltei]